MQACDPILCRTLLNALALFYQLLFENLGLSIISVTLLIRILLAPVLLKSIKSAQKMRELAPQIAKLKKRHKGDQKKFLEAQGELYKQNGVNPAAGCLPQILQIVVLIGFFGALSAMLRGNTETVEKLVFPWINFEGLESLNTRFLYLDLAKPDRIDIPGLPVPLPGPILALSVVVQFLSSKMMMPSAEKAQKAAGKTKGSLDDVVSSTQQQMIYLFPIMTLVIGLGFPSGLVLYWFVLSLFQLFFQDWVSDKSRLKPFISSKLLLK